MIQKHNMSLRKGMLRNFTFRKKIFLESIKSVIESDDVEIINKDKFSSKELIDLIKRRNDSIVFTKPICFKLIDQLT